MEYGIWLDLVNYRIYTGNIERELTDFIFGSVSSPDNWKVPEEWEDVLLPFPHEEYGLVLADIRGKIYTPEEVERFGLRPNRKYSDREMRRLNLHPDSEMYFDDNSYGIEPGFYVSGHPFYGCFRIFWRFELPTNNEAMNMSGFLVERTQEYIPTLKDSPKFGARERRRFSRKREIPSEIYILGGERLL